MRLGDQKGLGWGSVRRAISHLLTFLLDHQYTPLPHISPKLVQGGCSWHALCPLCHSGLALGEEYAIVLGRDLAAAPCPLSSPLALLVAPDSGVWAFSLLPSGARTETYRGAKSGHGLA